MLNDTLDRLLYDKNPHEMSRLARALSHRYRHEGATADNRPISDDQALSYAATRMPATFGALEHVFGQMVRVWPAFAPRTMLDVGAGPGTALWAAKAQFTSLAAFTAVEKEMAMQRLGELFAATDPLLTKAVWQTEDVLTSAPRQHDLVVAGYLLGELPHSRRSVFLDQAWAAAAAVLVLVEPGTPTGYGRIMAARTYLIERGATVVAPCPHSRSCPLSEGDWCHFSARVARTRRHRQLKGGSAPFEDEKFSYVVLARESPASAAARVIRHPLVRPGAIQLTLCSPEGLKTAVIKKQDGLVFRHARRVSWGDAWEG